LTLLVDFPVKELKLKRDLQNRLVSIINGVIIALLGGYYVWVLGQDVEGPNTPFTNMTCAIAMGYFAYDIAALWAAGILDLQTFIHHVASVGMFACGIYYTHGACSPVSALYYGEVTNSFMHMRYFIRSLGMRNTKLYEMAEYTFIFLYLYMRCFACLGLLVDALRSPVTPNYLKLVGLLVIFQSWAYSCIMIQMLRKRYNEFSERSRKGI
jgi:hypothetical protein